MTSARPAVVTRATGAPRRSSTALVATVVPWASRSGRSAAARAPAMARDGSSGVDSTLPTRPAASTRSVNVPPVSTPTSTGATLVGHRRPGPGLLGLRSLHRQHVDQVVHRVARVALHPPEADVAPPAELVDQRLPQVPVGHRLAGAVDPAPLDPALPPAVPEAVHDVCRVAHDLERAAGV